MRLSSTLVFALSAIATINTIAKIQQTNAHSWVHCSKYTGDVTNFQPSECKAWPRGFFKQYGKNEEFGKQQGYNHDSASVCKFQGRSSDPKEIAQYQQGEVGCINWVSLSHAILIHIWMNHMIYIGNCNFNNCYLLICVCSLFSTTKQMAQNHVSL
jgi:hypothetical protein